MKELLKLAESIRLILPFVGDKVHATVERMLTVPAKDRAKATAGFTPEDQATAERLFKVAADANADLVVFIASRGTVEPD